MFVQRDLLNAFLSWAPGGRDFVLSAATPITLFEPVAPPEQAAFVGWQAGALANSSPRESVTSQSTISSQWTQVMSPQPRASSELSQETEGHWSQFSLPAIDEGDLEGEGNELQNQRERSLASNRDLVTVHHPSKSTKKKCVNLPYHHHFNHK
ncbi:hypothetical protein BDZ45DRAFT_787712 [Acephala macrosclerotiorum]|nr:hypothetical protein BDZ45DRAFT_787712 [Acephala macrosclerotiorum]